MAAGTSTIRLLSAGAAGRVKKQLNDLYLFMSFRIHQELANFGVTAVRAAGSAAAPLGGAPRADGLATTATDANILRFIPVAPDSETAKDWEANVTLWAAGTTLLDGDARLQNAVQAGRPRLDLTNGNRVLVIVDSPVAGDVGWDPVLRVGAIRRSDLTRKVAEVTTFGVDGGGAATAATSSVTVNVAGGSVAGTVVTIPAQTNAAGIATLVRNAVNAGSDAALVVASVAGTDVTFVTDGADVTVTAAAGVTAVTAAAPAGFLLPFETYTFRISRGSGIGQAMSFVDDAGQIVEDIVAIDWNSLAAGLSPNGQAPAMTGAHRGVSIKIMTVPNRDADWIYHAFVRQINPNIPKDYREVADHFDGAADTIRAIAIPSLGIQKVFENVPGSFMNLRTRRVTMRADVRENNRFDASEVHYFLGVKGTPTITFNNDNESIANMECIMYRWITLS